MMKNVEKAKLRIIDIDFHGEKIDDLFLKKKSLKILLAEGFKKIKDWNNILGDKCEYLLFHRICDVSNAINNNWFYDCVNDEYFRSKLKEKHILVEDRIIINYYINWELHKEEIEKEYGLSNPYEPFIMIFERGSGYIKDRGSRITISSLVGFYYKDLETEMLKGEEVRLDHGWLDALDNKLNN